MLTLHHLEDDYDEVAKLSNVAILYYKYFSGPFQLSCFNPNKVTIKLAFPGDSNEKPLNLLILYPLFYQIKLHK